MKLSATALALLVGLVGPQGSASGAPQQRVEKVDYFGFAIGPKDNGPGSCGASKQGDWLPGHGCVYFMTQPGDRTVDIAIKDDSGSDVSAWVWQVRCGDGDTGGISCRYRNAQRFCSSLSRPVKILRSADRVLVALTEGPCPDGASAASTVGEVTFTISP